MILLVVRESNKRELTGFDCGAGDIERAQQLAQALMKGLTGDILVMGPDSTRGGDFIITVVAGQGTLSIVTELVSIMVDSWDLRGQLS